MGVDSASVSGSSDPVQKSVVEAMGHVSLTGAPPSSDSVDEGSGYVAGARIDTGTNTCKKSLLAMYETVTKRKRALEDEDAAVSTYVAMLSLVSRAQWCH